jgi:translation initiation factor IF-3
MKHICCLLSVAQAYRFTSLSTQRISHTHYSGRDVSLRIPKLRFSHYSSPRSFADNNTPPISQQKSGTIKDEEIHADFIQIVNENGNLDPPVRTADALRSLQRDRYSLVQVSPGGAGRPTVCKILSREMLREQQRTKEKALRVKKTLTKQIELNWAIDPHDLSHRLKSLSEFIERGRKVEVILTRKKRKRPPTGVEVRNVMDTVMKAIDGANAMQIKPMEGQPGKHVLITVKKKEG